MTQAANLNASIGSVRRRLWLLLLRAFGVVVLLISLFILVATFIVLGSQTSRNPFYRAPVAILLETYYQGHGSWQGVETLLDRQTGLDTPYLVNEWRRAVLLDTYGRILVDQGRLDTERIGLVYANQDGDGQVILSVAGLQVGALVFERSLLSSPLRLVLELLPPILLASTLLGLLTLVIGLLLMRRVVNPLAEVIAGAQAVAGGDLSARVPVHQSRDDLHALSESFNQMASSLERSDLERRAMLADVAHELRTPLTILRGRLEGILDGVYHADPAHIAPALEEVYLLERLVDDLRLLTLAEARQLPLEERRFDLGKLAQKAVSTFEAEAVELGIHLTIQPLPEPDEDRIVCADPQRVEQVAGNLIGNALRYVPAGGEVTVRLETQGGQSSLIVADNGAGVAADELPYIFDRFWRGEKSRGRASGGAGLGLAIARQLVEAQGGKIWARNLPEGGFEVGFTLKSAGD